MSNFKQSSPNPNNVVPNPTGEVLDWGLQKINAEVAWRYSKGNGVKVAILDTGCDHKHLDLAENIKGIRNFTNSSYGAVDLVGHGTHVAGIVAAVDNDEGMIGVAPEAELYIAKVLNDDGSGVFKSVIAGIDWAILMGVDIINMSLGAPQEPPQDLHNAILRAREAGITVFSATGNENGEVCWPAQYKEVIAVSAIDKYDNRAQFSNFGLKNEIIAPGVDILSTYPNNKYARLSGTSMATPIIAGAAALFIAYYKDQHGERPSRKDVYEALAAATEDLGVPGRDPHYGIGRINLAKMFE